MIYCNYTLFSSWKVKINHINSCFLIIVSLILWFYKAQKQPCIYVLQKRSSSKCCKIYRKTLVNKKFTTFPTMIKLEKYIDNRAKISENSDEFLRCLVKSLKIKFLHPMKRSMGILSFKIRNLIGLKNDIFYQQSREFFQWSALRSSRPEVFYKNVALNNFEKFIGKHLCWSPFSIKLQA